MTAPAVIPAMIWRAATKVKSSGGITISVPIAMIRPHCTPCSVRNRALCLPAGYAYCDRSDTKRQQKLVPGNAEGKDRRYRHSRTHQGEDHPRKHLPLRSSRQRSQLLQFQCGYLSQESNQEPNSEGQVEGSVKQRSNRCGHRPAPRQTDKDRGFLARTETASRQSNRRETAPNSATV